LSIKRKPAQNNPGYGDHRLKIHKVAHDINT
jgi:hypothetical protein